jgi:tripartite-type tricarboxylate transporter receptor subunit TctC
MPGLRIAAVLLVVGALGASAAAQDWPTRPLSMVVPFAPGGSVDGNARTMAGRLSEILGQQVVVENVGGAGVNQTLYKRPLYDSIKDFAPVGLINQGLYVLLVRKDLPVSTLPEFIAYAKANQARMQYGSGGAGSTTHLVCILLNMALGISVTHVPYRGSGPAMHDLVGGRLDYLCEPVPTALPQISGNAAKPIVLLARNRTKVLPEVPTAHEQGLKDFEVLSWNAFFFPKGTPDAIVRRLNAATNEALDTPAVRARLEALGLEAPEPARRSPEYLAEFVKSEIERWAAPIRASGVSVE